MGVAELNIFHKELIINSWIITYGNAATPELTEQIREEIEYWWNEPDAIAVFDGNSVTVRFRINAYLRTDLQPEHIFENVNPVLTAK